MSGVAHDVSMVMPRSAHPNELDRRRVERSLRNRKRYRYVKPSVLGVMNGYLVQSPCCSRNIDPLGGTIDVALLQHVPGGHPWQLFRKDHAAGEWRLHATYEHLTDLLGQLNDDTQRVFWQ